MNLKPIYDKLMESYGYFEDHITELDNQADGKYYLLRAYGALVDLQNIVDNFNVTLEPKVSEIDKALAELIKTKNELLQTIENLKNERIS